MPRVHRCRANGCHNMVEWPANYCPAHAGMEAALEAKHAEYRDRSRYNRVTRNSSGSKRQQYAFYRSTEWRHLRKQILQRDYYLCQYCKAMGKLTSAKTVDHIVPIEVDSGRETNPTNLTTICRDCHRRKTVWEQKYYGTGHQSDNLTGAPKITSVAEISRKINKPAE